MRSADGAAEVAVAAYKLFASTELLDEMALERMMAKLSTRRYSAGLEPVGTQVEATARSTSKSAVSRRFVAPPNQPWPRCWPPTCRRSIWWR